MVLKFSIASIFLILINQLPLEKDQLMKLLQSKSLTNSMNLLNNSLDQKQTLESIFKIR